MNSTPYLLHSLRMDRVKTPNEVPQLVDDVPRSPSHTPDGTRGSQVESPYLPTTDLVFYESLESTVSEIVMRTPPNLDRRPDTQTLVPNSGRERGVASEQLEEDGLSGDTDPLLPLR